jgi:hypothetical protein
MASSKTNGKVTGRFLLLLDFSVCLNHNVLKYVLLNKLNKQVFAGIEKDQTCLSSDFQ